MEKMKIVLSVIFGGIAAFFRQYYLIIALVSVVIVFDFITGIIKAKMISNGWDSEKGTKGFFKKIVLLLSLMFGIFLDFSIPLALSSGIGVEMPFSTHFSLIIGFYIIFNECISICENLYQCNEKAVPKWVVDFLKITKDKLDAGEKNESN